MVRYRLGCIGPADDARRITGDNGIGGNILRHHAPGTHDRVLSHGDVTQDDGAAADGRSALNDRRLNGPVGFCLQFAVLGDCPW